MGDEEQPQRRRTDADVAELEAAIGLAVRESRDDAVGRLLVAVLCAVAIVGITSGAGIAIAVYQSDQADKAAQEAQQSADEAKAILAQVQAERKRNVRGNCEDVNQRHDNAAARLDGLIEQIEDPIRRAAAERSKDFTLTLIDAIVPERNCEAYAEGQVQAGPGG